MQNQNFEKNKIRNLILIIILLILIAINIYVYIIHHTEETQVANINNIVNESTNYSIATEEQTTNSLETKISNMTERNRMQTYFGQYITYIESEKYETAYSKLNASFKEKYFPTIDKFKEYYKTKYPSISNLTYSNIERQGEYYILTVTVSASLDTSFKSFEESVVIKENGNNDYEISFKVE